MASNLTNIPDPQSEPPQGNTPVHGVESARHTHLTVESGRLSPIQQEGLCAGGAWLLTGFVWGILAVAVMLRGHALEFLHLPVLAFGLACCAQGSYRWYRVPAFSKEGTSRAKQSLVTALLGLYFAPFVYWWTRNPGSYYYAINSLLFAMAVSMFLIHINGFAQAFARHIKDPLFATETRLCGWIILVVVGTYFLHTFIQLLLYQFSHGGDMFPYQVMRSGWFFLMAPFALTAAGIHKIRTVSKEGKQRPSRRRVHRVF